MRFADKTYIGLYHNPETGLWAKQTMKNYKNGKTFSWKSIEKFPPRFLSKITMLNLAGFNVKVPGVGRLKKSQKHKGLLTIWTTRIGISRRRKMNPIEILGYWIRLKYRMRAQESGYYVAAKQLRKQGIPLEIARLILL